MDVFDALAHPMRREILTLLRDRDLSAGEIAAHFTVSKPTLSGHFAVLRDAGLVLSERRGTQVIYQLNLSMLEGALLGLMNRVAPAGAKEGRWTFAPRD